MNPLSLGQFLLPMISLITTASQAASGALSDFISEATKVAVAETSVKAAQARFQRLKGVLLAHAEAKVKPPENHDLQKAFYISFLKATEFVYTVRLEQLGITFTDATWRSGLKRHLMEKLYHPRFTTLSLGVEPEKQVLSKKRRELHLHISQSGQFSAADVEQRLPLRADVEVLRRLTDEAKNHPSYAHLALEVADTMIAGSVWYSEVGEPVKEIARKSLIECLSAFFAEEIKANSRVQTALNSEFLAALKVGIDTLVSDLGDAHVWLREVRSELRALKRLVEDRFRTAFAVIDPEFLEGQKGVPLKPFLDTNIGDWALVAQGRSLERNLTAEIVERALQPYERAVLQIIHGEPGSGKTTLLRQIGAKLALGGCAVLEAQPNADFGNFQYYVHELTKKAKARVFILIDDLYRDEQRAGLIDVFSDLRSPLPITIIATTPSFEDRTEEIRESNYLDKLPAVSSNILTTDELARLRLMPWLPKLSPSKFKELTSSRMILVVMLQICGGAPMNKILSNAAERLKKKSQAAYDAWGTVITFGRWSLPVPTSILERIIQRPGFGELMRRNPKKAGTLGLIFRSEHPFMEGWSPGHVVIAEAAFKTEFRHTLENKCEAAILVADPKDSEHVQFLGRMFRSLSSAKPDVDEFALLVRLVSAHESKIYEIASTSNSAHVDWAYALIKIGRSDLAEHFLKSTLPLTTSTAQRCAQLLKATGSPEQAFEILEQWVEGHPNDTHARVYLIRLLGRGGHTGRGGMAINRTREWLGAHEEDIHVRRALLRSLKRGGRSWHNRRCIRKEIDKTLKWLETREEDTLVRSSWLSLVKEKGDATFGDLGGIQRKRCEQFLWVASSA